MGVELVLDRLSVEASQNRLVQLTKDETRQVILKIKTLEALAGSLLAQLIEAGVKVELDTIERVSA